MQRFEISHRFACTPDEYLAVIDGPDFHQRLSALLKLRERALLDHRDVGEETVVRWHVVPERDPPAPVRKFLGPAGMAYVEEDRRPHATPHRRHWRILMDALNERRFQCAGTFELRPADEGQTERVIRGEIGVKILVVGGLVERQVVKAIRESYLTTTELVRQMLEERRSGISAAGSG